MHRQTTPGFAKASQKCLKILSTTTTTLIQLTTACRLWQVSTARYSWRLCHRHPTKLPDQARKLPKAHDLGLRLVTMESVFIRPIPNSHRKSNRSRQLNRTSRKSSSSLLTSPMATIIN